MIIFLTLCYVGLLAVAVKLGFIKLNLFWKLSPLVWTVALFLGLFLPMQWGAPGGPVNVFQYVVEVIPNVTGEVVEVPVKPLEHLKAGDVLFRIDSTPFQAKVDQLSAQLEATIQEVEQLKAAEDAALASVTRTEQEVDIKKTDIEIAASNITVAETEIAQAKTGAERARQLVNDFEVQVAAAKRELDRQNKLRANNAASESEFDRAEVQYTSLASQLNSSRATLQETEQKLEGSKAKLLTQLATAKNVDLSLKQLVEAELPAVKATARQAELAANSMIGDEHTKIAEVRALLKSARFDLENTVVRAPSSGHVMAVALRPGQRVANLPLRSWMPFIDHEKSEIVVAVQQYALRFVKPGQEVECTFKLLPGQVFGGTVDRIAYTNPSAQLQPSGQLVSQSKKFMQAEPYGVVIQVEDDSADSLVLAGGASGSAAIYTDSMSATHVIRRVMIRMDAWMNYIIP